ncbi:myb-like protein AA [Musca domestica]|uniref:Myb-like protein AA n=1 Tax=Musca domestica TaxID=7370 RepID=A0ABM3V4H9_MUSDO|nr:myb-like protein AA [Musca domestica]
MRNRLASLIVVKQEPNSNNLVASQTNLGSQTQGAYGAIGISGATEILNIGNSQHNLCHNEAISAGDLSTSTGINIKTENHFYEINNNNLHHSDNYNYNNTSNTTTNTTNGGKTTLPPSPITASTTPTNFIYPCRNLFPDGCDISHHHSHHQQHQQQHQQHQHQPLNNNCSNYYYNLSDTPSPVTPPYAATNGDKFLLKSEPLPYEHSVLDVVAAAASATDNLWCLSNLTYRKQLGSFHISASASPEHSFQNNSSNNNNNGGNGSNVNSNNNNHCMYKYFLSRKSCLVMGF